MTHRHTLLKIPIILITITLVLTGCQNIFNRITEPTVKYGKITVKVDLGETSQNARFIQGNSAQDDRSAMPSTFDGANYVFAGVVHDSSTTVAASMLKIAESVTPDATKEKLTIEIPFELSASDRNNYTLSIYAFKSGTTSISAIVFASPIFYGTTSVTIPANAITPSSVGSVKLVPKTLPSDINGNINLKIEVPKGCTLSATCNTSGHSASSCGFDFTKDTALSDASTVSDFYTFTESNTSTGIASGEHDVVFTVQKSSTPVYLWVETITVYPYLTTNKWINGLDDSTDTRVITESQFYSTFYVSGASPNVFTASGNDSTGDGSVAKPFATVQKAVDKVLAMNNGADGESYTIFVDGTVTADGTATGRGMVASISTTRKLKLYIIGLGTTKAILNANLSAATDNGSVMVLSGSELELKLQNLKLTGGKNSNAGGGIYIGSGKVTIKDCEISGNSCVNGGGGGIFINGGTITLTNCTISDNSTTSSEGGGIYNSGTLIINSGEISGNKVTDSNNNGGGIYNSGTVTITGGTISDNTASSGKGIYNNGTLEMSGSVQVTENNEIYLPSGKFITIADNLTASGTVARISLDSSQYAIGTKVLQAATTNASGTALSDGVLKSLITNNIGKFILNAPNAPTTDYKDFYLTPDSTGKNVVLAKPNVGVSVGLPVGEYTFKVLKNGEELDLNIPLSIGDVLTFKVYNSANVEVTNAENYKIAVKQNGDEIPSLTKSGANVSAVKVAIPQKFADVGGTIDVFVSATIDGVTYDASAMGIAVRAIKYVEVATADLSTYLSTHTGQVAVTVKADTDEDIAAIKAALDDSSVTVTGVDLKLTGSVTSIIDRTFFYCRSLTSIEISSSVISIGASAFYGCSSLTSVEIPRSVTSIGDSAFYGCSSLTSIVIPSGVTSIHSAAFNSCSLLDNVTILATTPPTLGPAVFDDNNSGRKIYVPAEYVDVYKTASGWSSYKNDIFAITP